MSKRIIAVILCLITLLSAAFTAFAAQEEEIIIDGNCVIVPASDSLSAAAEKLAGFIGGAVGETPAVAGETENKTFIKLEINKEKAENGYSIKAVDNGVEIAGSSLPWAVRGAYAFAEQLCGVKCYTSKLTVYGKDKIAVPADTNITYEPYFEYTDTDWISPHDTDYSLFNGLNGAEYREIPAELGGMVDYISGFAHTFTNQFCAADKYFDEHPEYFSYSFGRRTPKQLCLSNSEVLEIVTQEVLDLLKEKHDPDAELQIISLTQHDNIAYCRCDKCRATDKKYGSHAGTMLEFVNAVARKVKEAGYDNVALDTFAYRYTRTPPKGIEAEDNVIVRLCSIECCFSHAFDDPDCKTNKEFMTDLAGWSKICKRLYIWDYCTNFCNFVGIYPDFGVLQRNMQIFYENNVKGIYEEGNYSLNIESADTEFAELRAYMLAKLFQDPYCDIDAVRDSFNNAYYGDGGKYISEFLDIVTENAPKKHLGIYQSMQNTLPLSRKDVAACNELWKKAEEAAEGEAKQHVLNSELCWRYWKMKNMKTEFSNIFKYFTEKEQLTGDINGAGITRWMEAGEVRSFFVSIFQDLYFKVYPLVNGVLKLLYKA